MRVFICAFSFLFALNCFRADHSNPTDPATLSGILYALGGSGLYSFHEDFSSGNLSNWSVLTCDAAVTFPAGQVQFSGGTGCFYLMNIPSAYTVNNFQYTVRMQVNAAGQGQTRVCQQNSSAASIQAQLDATPTASFIVTRFNGDSSTFVTKTGSTVVTNGNYFYWRTYYSNGVENGYLSTDGVNYTLNWTSNLVLVGPLTIFRIQSTAGTVLFDDVVFQQLP